MAVTSSAPLEEPNNASLAAPRHGPQAALSHATSVVDFGIILGALLAVGMTGEFSPVWRISRSHLVASVVGGLLLGCGARLTYGCNIGAFFSGIASGSLHG